MRYLSVCIFAICVIGFLGCGADTSPSHGIEDPYPPPTNNPQISVLAPDLRPWLGFQTARIDTVNNLMRVQTPVRNLSNKDLLIDYRYLFYDENDIQLEPVMSWRFQEMRPKQVVYLTANATDPRAEYYRLETKWSR